MSYVVAVWKIKLDAKLGISYEDRVIGPFRDDERAQAYAGRVERALERHGLEDDWSVSVSEMYSPGYAAGELVEGMAEVERLLEADAAGREGVDHG